MTLARTRAVHRTATQGRHHCTGLELKSASADTNPSVWIVSGALWSLCGACVCTCVDQIPVVSSIPRERQQLAERFVAAELGFDLLE